MFIKKENQLHSLKLFRREHMDRLLAYVLKKSQENMMTLDNDMGSSNKTK